MDEVEIENSTNPENPENDQPQKAKYAIQVKIIVNHLAYQ